MLRLAESAAKFVLAGYSQGAMATHQALKELDGTPAGKAVIGVFLVADGDRYNTDARPYGTSDAGATGVRAGLAKFLPFVRPRPADVVNTGVVADICDKGDLVCDWSVPTLRAGKGGSIHGSYDQAGNKGITKAVQGMKDRINSKIRTMVLLQTLELPTGYVGRPYNYTLRARGGDGLYTFTVTNLPSGLTATGALITGVPKESSTRNVTIKVSDRHGQSNSWIVPLLVRPSR